tara:strand:- start:245 stop:979 length:735 start_codon:yes stop_codon:yes gene_type:complete
MNPRVAEQIKDLTSCECFCGNIFDLAAKADVGEYLAVWYDMTGRDVPLLDVAHASDHVMLTVNTRGVATDSMERHLVSVVKSLPSTRLLNYGVYMGTGKKLNMTYCFFHQKKPKRCDSGRSGGSGVDTETDASTETEAEAEEACEEQRRLIGDNPVDWLHVPLRVPLSRWHTAGLEFDTTLYKISDGCVTATVVDFCKDKLVLKYQTVGGRMMADQLQFENRMPRVTTKLAQQWLDNPLDATLG